MASRLNLKGQRFGRLLVLSFAGSTNQGGAKWLCRCDCGKEKVIRGSCLTSGHTRSCGCYHHDRDVEYHTKHGGSRTRLHIEWQHMKARCNPNYFQSVYYADRGIRVCKEWSESFEVFRDWALSHGYRDDLTIDRIDVNGNYEPTNCRWATTLQQARNKRNTILWHGKSIGDWCDELGLDQTKIRQRLFKLGWSFEKALELKGDIRANA